MVSWICGPDQLDRAPEIPVIRTTYTWCRSVGPDRMRCDRPVGHSGRCYESVWDTSTDGTEIRFVIGCWSDE